MKVIILPFLTGIFCFVCLLPAFCSDEKREPNIFEWTQLPPLPDAVGLAGAFAGVSNDALIVAGGANFPQGPPWDGHSKVWHNEVYVLTSPDGAWQKAGQLPHPLAYGVALTTPEGVLCLGGGDADQHYQDVFLIKWEHKKIAIEQLPPMPGPVAFFCGALLESKVYVAGGLASPDADRPMQSFWMLDLSLPQEQRQWQELESWSGPPRMLSVGGVQDNAFFLMSGADQVAGEDGEPVRRFLKDAYRYQTGVGWEKIADLPRAAVAAPSPAVNLGQAHLMVFGGDDGKHFFEQQHLKDEHPGFTQDILAYHTITDTWTSIANLPIVADPGHPVWPPVTTVTTMWHGKIVIPSGEIRPGVRSPQVLMGEPLQKKAGFKTLDWSVLGIYLLVLVIVGFYFSKREGSTHDFFLGGNRIPWWAAGLSIFATQLSAITFMAIPAKAFEENWVYFIANMTIVAVAPIVILYFLPFFIQLNVTSAYEYLEKRFNLVARLIGSSAYLLFQFGRMGIVIFLPSLALNAVTDIDIFVCILLIGVLATVYTVMGGIEAVIWTDVLQVFVLLGGAIISLFLITSETEGGFSTILAAGMEENKFKMANLTWDASTDALWVVIIGSFFANMVSYSSDQTVIQRYLTTESKKKAERSIWTNAILTVPASVLFFGVGTALWMFYKTKPELLNPLSQGDDIFPWYIVQQLPAGFSGLVIAGIVSAAMSSLDSSMNSMATVITIDFYKRFRPNASDMQRLKLARLFTVLLGIIGTGFAIYMAMLGSTSMWDQYFKVVGLFGGGLAGMFVAGIFTKRINSTGIIIGFSVSAAVLFFVQNLSTVHFFLYAGIGIVTCFVAGYIASIVFPCKKAGLKADE